MPHNLQKKFIEFFDVRAAEAAFHALNGRDIAGKKMKLESRSNGGAPWWYYLAKFTYVFSYLCRHAFVVVLNMIFIIHPTGQFSDLLDCVCPCF